MSKRIVRTTSARIPKTKVKLKNFQGKIVTSRTDISKIVGVRKMEVIKQETNGKKVAEAMMNIRTIFQRNLSKRKMEDNKFEK